MKTVILSICLCLILSGCEEVGQSASDLSFVYLTFSQENTSDHIVFNIHSNRETESVTVHLDTLPQGGQFSNYQIHQTGRYEDYKLIKRRVHRVTVNHLAPGTRYYYVVEKDGKALDVERFFETLPQDTDEIRFVAGGDTDVGEEVALMNKAAAQTNPHFVLMGGDIAYDNGLPTSAAKWDRWLRYWQDHMKTPDGRVIPIVAAIGNHEALGGFNSSPSKAPYYYKYFEQGGKSYFRRNFSNIMGLVVLDSDHTENSEGPQRDFLTESLTHFNGLPLTAALYHVGLYPSVRDYQGSGHKKLRRLWEPVFSKFNLSMAFENHDHSLKRTHPIKNGQIDMGGTVYLVDGCWGKGPREVNDKSWYLVQAQSKRHFWLVNATKNGARLRAIGESGEVLDQTLIPSRAALVTQSHQR
ncbi:MAG: metallophosphoesterase family protein [Oligoflexia bacterium]|nr:metallophosphoesterase family protein [Oligoflexia bacterium]